jgi:beta-lactamase class A
MKSMKGVIQSVLVWARGHKKQLLYGLAGCIGVIIIAQLFYPNSRLVPFAMIDGQRMSSWTKDDAAKRLDRLYADDTIAIQLGNDTRAIQKVTLSKIGTSVKNRERVNNLDYPWYLRLVPGSILWVNAVQRPTAPEYSSNNATLTKYITERFGEGCRIEPTNATLTFKDDTLSVVPAINGGTCKRDEVEKKLRQFRASLTQKDVIAVPVQMIKPAIEDKAAGTFKDLIESQVKNGISLDVAGKAQVVPRSDVLSWAVFKNDGALDITFDTAKASEYLNKTVTPKVAKPTGVSKVTTHDFIETSRVNGATGQTLDIVGTLAGIREYVLKKAATPSAIITSLPPRVEYTRTYSPTDAGLSALIKHYAEDHPGIFGISFIELSGKNRRAEYQQDKIFTTASTYKLFVAYSTLKRVEEGKWQWSDQIQGGRNLDRCFDDMIVKSDNACAEAMLQKIGFREITSEIQALGMRNSTFLKGDSPQTTAGDLSNFLAILNANQMLTQQSSRDRLIGAMKRNVYRQGIPAGASGQVADKVGFLNSLFHDAAIVYSPSGTYVLTIMSDGSNWATIADLTRKIETLRTQ